MPEELNSKKDIQVVSPIVDADGHTTGFKFMGQLYQQENTIDKYAVLLELVTIMPLDAIEQTLQEYIDNFGHEAPFQRTYQFLFEFLAYSPDFNGDMDAAEVMANMHNQWAVLWDDWLTDSDEHNSGRMQ